MGTTFHSNVNIRKQAGATISKQTTMKRGTCMEAPGRPEPSPGETEEGAQAGNERLNNKPYRNIATEF
jgi:hypothetical protein